MRHLLIRLGLLAFVIALGSHAAVAQTNISGTINTYARVTGISGATLTVTNINSGPAPVIGTFNNGNGTGSRAILIQMRGATVDTASATTSSSRGNLSSLDNAGNWEWVQVSSTGAGTITLSAIPTLTYTLSGDVQIVHVPYYTGSTLVVVNANLTAPSFNTTTLTGGVLALAVEQSLRLDADLESNGDGFAGGAASTGGGGGDCENGTFAATLGANYGGKGSSVRLIANATNTGARGNWASGGGGGNLNNAGGGGGANFTAGGPGSFGRAGTPACNSAPAGQGEAGVALNYAGGKIFLGGGGGGGQDGTNPTAGGAGGGIIILRAGTLLVSGARQIRANGITANNVPPDGATPPSGSGGAGGGGAGGVVYLDISNYNLPGSPGCAAGSIVVQANGGNGGDSQGTDGVSRGGGGGGGAGYIGLTNTSIAGQCISFSATAGSAGLSCSSGGGGCPTVVGGSGGTAPGSSTTGPVTPPGGPPPLPVTLVTFTGRRVGSDVALSWVTASEQNNSHFTLERSADGVAYSTVATVAGSGTTQRTTRYDHLDREAPIGTLYYRLRQIDFDGAEEIFPPLRLTSEVVAGLRVLRNPVRAGEAVTVEVSGALAGQRLELVDLAGRVLAYQLLSGDGLVLLRAHELSSGLYLVRLTNTRLSARVVVE